MSKPKNYEGLEPTHLHRKDYTKRYRFLKSAILKEKPEFNNKWGPLNRAIYSRIGFPYWNDAGEALKKGRTGFNYYYMNQGNPRKVSQRRGSNYKASDVRKESLKLSNEHLTEDQKARTRLLQKEMNKLGMQADHKLEVQTTGPMIKQLNRELQLGLITKKEHKNELLKLRKRGIGDDPKNFQPLTGQQNSAKRSEVDRKNKALEKLEKTKLSDRYAKTGFKFEEIFKNKKVKPNSMRFNKSGSGVALDTNFMDDLVKQKSTGIYKTPRDTFHAPIPLRDELGKMRTNFLPIDKV